MTNKVKTFEEIIQQYKNILFKVVNIYCEDSEDRKDLMQEILIQLWQSFDKYDNKYKLTTWIYRIAINVSISFYRKGKLKRRFVVPIDDETNFSDTNELSDSEYDLSLLEQFISELRPLDKALMILFLDEKNYQEIADILGISTSNVSTKIARIKVILKKRFLTVNK